MLLVKSVKTLTINDQLGIQPVCCQIPLGCWKQISALIVSISAIHYENKYLSEDTIVKDT